VRNNILKSAIICFIIGVSFIMGNNCERNNSNVDKNIDVNKPVENPKLKNALSNFISNKTENNAIKVGSELNQSIFLIAILTDEMKTKSEGTDKNTVTIEKGSKIKILNVFNEKNECFLPVFTDWEEIRNWTKETVSGIIMPAKEAWEFVLNSIEYKGIVINPAGTNWTLTRENIMNLLKDMK
jgi:hypothetical protein